MRQYIRRDTRFSQSGPQMACASAFALRRANLLLILAGERVFHGKPSFPSLVGVARNRDRLERGRNAVNETQIPSLRRGSAVSADVVFAFLWRGQFRRGYAPSYAPPSGTQTVTYQITVTGTSPGTAADAGHGTVVNLIVQ